MQRERKNHLLTVCVSVCLVLSIAVIMQFCQIRTLRDDLNSVCFAKKSSLSNNNTYPISKNIELCSYDKGLGVNSRSLEDISRSVCLIQGEYLFVNQQGDRISWRDISGVISASNIVSDSYRLNENLIEIQYTGSGFLIDGAGYIVTNKHVALPWSETLRDREIINAGYRPQMAMFRAFFPGIEKPLELEYVTGSDSEDIAILKIIGPIPAIPALECDYDSELSLGMPLTIVGYPTGFDLLTARINSYDSHLNYSDFDGLGMQLAEKKLIRPMANSGICGQVTDNKIAYDAATAIGASGAPVINKDGKVIALNTALLKGFTGTNFGVHISKVKPLLVNISAVDPY